MAIKSIAEILAGPKISNWKNSVKTRDAVASQIEARWGKAELSNYSAETSALPYSKWVSLGYRPKRGSKALKSVTYLEQKNAQGEVIRRFPRTVNLFYYRDVEEVTSQKTC
jgi:hypothetical protein